MRPFIVTDIQAGKLPRWGLLLLVLLYALPGLIGRDPWRGADAAGFGIALTMSRGQPADWWMPNIAGLPTPAQGPLGHWIDACGALIARMLAPAGVPFEHVGVHLLTALQLIGAFWLIWHAGFRLALRPGVQPSDPFGASATPVTYARAIADSALLLLLATLGLLVRVHETTGNVAQLVWIAAFLYGLAHALDRPRRGGVVAGAAIGATAASSGLALAFSLVFILGALLAFVQQYRLVARSMLPRLVVTALLVFVWWPLLLLASGEAGRAHLAAWWAVQLADFSPPGGSSLVFMVRTMPWFFWPTWPVAAWAVWRWRSRRSEPAVALPLVSAVVLGLSGGFGPSPGETSLLPAALPLALLAAVGLPTLRRSIVSLIDWFAVTSFTVAGVVIWAYWIALMTGFPPRMAFSATRLAPEFRPTLSMAELILGLAATAAWLALVRWRISRRPRAIWRAVVLSSGGLVLAWFLLMTLWLPVFNERNTYRDLGTALRQALSTAPDQCIDTRELGAGQRAHLAYFAYAKFADARSPGACPWLLVQRNGPVSRTAPPPLAGATVTWHGQRSADRDESFTLYRFSRRGGRS